MSDIRLEGVSKRYGAVAAADEVDLAVAQGEFVTILGPSGSGKTTLLSLIAGLNRPTAGRIFIGGRDVTDAPAQQRNIGLVFQSYALFPHMTVLENVLFPLGVRKIGGAAARTPGARRAEAGAARRPAGSPALAAFRRPAAARGAGPRHRLQARHPAARRAAGRARPQAARGAAGRAEAAPAHARRHDAAGDARPGRGAVAVRPHHGAGQGPHPAGRGAGRGLSRPANRFVAEFLGIANFVGMADGRTGLVRPERVRLAPAGINGGQPARVVEAIYLGQMVRYHLALERRGGAGRGGACRSSARPSPRASRSRCRGMRPISGRWRDVGGQQRRRR